MTNTTVDPNDPATIIDRAGADSVSATADISALSTDAVAPRVEQESRWTTVKRAFRTAPLTAWFGMIVILLYVLVAIFADLVAPYGEREVIPGMDPNELPNDTVILGADELGRDMLSRMIYAARNTVGIAFLTTILSFTVGGFLGLTAAVFGGWIDNILSRIVDVLMAIPQLIFALLLLTIFGTAAFDLNLPFGVSIPMPGWTTMVLVIALLDSTRVFRLLRAVGMNIVVMDYVEAAKLRGEGTWWLVRKEILPNAMAPLIAEFGLRFCFVFLTISALSFLGLGIQPPTADWGSMVKANAGNITFANLEPIYALFPLLPAGAIALLTVAVNFVVDWMLHRSSGLKD